MAKNSPQPQNTSSTDTTVFVKGMLKDPDASLVSKDNWTHAINAINNSSDGDIGTLGNEQANKLCGNAPFTLIGTIHLYGDKWVLYSTNNVQSEIGLWDDSECKYETLINDHTCYDCNDPDWSPGLNFDTQHLITGASKENFDCSWQVYWDDGKNPSRTLNLDYIPYVQNIISEEGADCILYEDTECVDFEKLRLAPHISIPCVDISRSADGGQLRNGSYQAFIAYVINDQIIGEQIAKEIGIYSTEQSHISIDFINPALKSVPLTVIPLSSPAFERSDKMFVVNDYLIRQGPYEQYDFNYQPLANEIHAHWVVSQFPSDYYKKGGNKPTFMRDEVYSFFIRFVYKTGEKSKSYHIPGRAPTEWTDENGDTYFETDPAPGLNDLATAAWDAGGQIGDNVPDKVFEVFQIMV